MDSCVFCRKPGSSEEHIFGSWILKYVGPGNFTLTRESGRTKTGLTRTLGHVTRSTCVACNTGWMSDLEQDAERLLAGPIQGKAASWSLPEMETLATWGYKVALMVDRSGRTENRTVPLADFHYLYDERRPPWHVAVDVARFAAAETDLVVSSRPTFIVGDRGATPDGYRIVFSIGHVVVAVVKPPSNLPMTAPRFRTSVNGVEADILRRLWPPGAVQTDWPPATALSQEGLHALSLLAPDAIAVSGAPVIKAEPLQPQ